MGNCEIVAKVKKMEKLVEEWIPLFSTEEKCGKCAEDPDIQIHKIVAEELRHDDRVDKPGLIVEEAV
jgi:hypothetical protein